MSRRFEVHLYDHVVGILSERPQGGTEFRFSPSYRELVPRPVLGQKFEDDLFRVYRSRKGLGLPDFFANLIPEGQLRTVIEKSAGLEAGDDLALLGFVGQDLPGAVSIRPTAEEFPTGDEHEQAEHTGEEEAAEEGSRLRFSLAGLQLKFSMLREGENLALPVAGRGGEWIVKFDSPTYPRLPENEWSMLQWARASGYDVPECHLHEVEQIQGFPRRLAPRGARVLAVRRFDRGPEGRIHQEDLAQAVGLPPRGKYDHVTYEAMAALVRGFIGEEGAEELIRRLVFVVATGNNDAHLKNWALLYPDSIQARWSPLYDQVSTVAWEQTDRELSLKLAGVKEFGRIDRSAFERVAMRANLQTARVLELVDGTLERLREAWREVVPDLYLPVEHIEALRNHWRRVPLLRAVGPLE